LVTDILLYLIFFIELQESAFRVIADNYVTIDGRTSVVHCACAFAFAFGEDNHCICLVVGIFEVGIILL
jgi:isoleucyl-tRNA synthetase